MKKIVTLIALCFPLIALAQIEKGKSVLTGSLAYSTTNIKGGANPNTSSSQLNAFVSYSYLVSNRWAIGARPSLYHNRVDNGNGFWYKNNQMLLGPFVRRYISLNEKFFFFLEGGVDADLLRTRDVEPGSPDVKTKRSGVHLYVYPGVTYLITNKIALQVTLGGLNFTSSKTDGRKTNSFAADARLSGLGFGASYIF